MSAEPPASPPVPTPDLAPGVEGEETPPLETDKGPDALGAHAVEAVGERIREAARRDEERASALDPREAAGIEPLTPEAIEQLGLADVHVCPICQGYGGADANVMLAALGSIVEQLAPYPQSTVFDRCSECNGWGSVLTGARRGESGIQPCPKCNGNGYVDKRSDPLAPIASRGVDVPQATAESFAGVDPMRFAPADGGRPPAVGMVWDDVARSWVYPT